VVVAAAVAAAYVVFGNPFAGPLPGDWKKHHESDVAATLAVPAAYQRTTPDRTSDKSHWVTYTDPSGSIWVFLSLDKKSEDTNGYIKDSAAAEMYSDNGDFKTSGSVDLDMGKATETVPKPTGTYQGRPSAENTVTYDSDDTQNPLPRELRILYYKTSAGDMYRLIVSYPGKGDFTARGREVARAAIANLDIDTL
jgi:hypothetical protein